LSLDLFACLDSICAGATFDVDDGRKQMLEVLQIVKSVADL